MMALIEHFHWIRPLWLWALLPLALLLWFGWRQGQRGRGWSAVVDPRLLPWLLVGQAGRGRRWPLAYWGLLGTLAVVALAGPAWKQLPTPVYQRSSALIVALDLSASMNAEDIKPSRIARARLKLIDLLEQRRRAGGQTALIAFAGTAYTVTPLTDDVRTIESMVSSLSPEIMPAQGSRADRAIDKARELLTNAGLQQGDLLLITDGLSRRAEARLLGMAFGGLRVSVMGVGTPQGAPIPNRNGGFIKNRKGEIVIARLDEAPLRQLAQRGGGLYVRMRADDADLRALQQLIEQPVQVTEARRKADFQADRWREEGPWLLLLILPLAALALRRGFVIGLLAALLLAPTPGGLWAADEAPATAEQAGRNDGWQRWLLTPDQRAERALRRGEAEKAEALFERPDWKAAAAYKAGRYDEAARLLEQLPADDPDTLYNRANALARSGRLEDALKAYDAALNLRPDDEDARYNRALVEEALKMQQNKQNPQGQNQQGQNQQGQNQQGQNQQGQNQQGQNQQGQNQQGQNQQGQNPQGQNPQGQNPRGQNPTPAASGEEEGETSTRNPAEEQAAIERLRAEAEEQRRKAESSSAADRAREAGRPDKAGEREEQARGGVASGPQATERQTLEQQAEAQWLRRIPDDPGGLLRNKSLYQYSRQRPEQTEDEPW